MGISDFPSEVMNKRNNDVKNMNITDDIKQDFAIIDVIDVAN